MSGDPMYFSLNSKNLPENCMAHNLRITGDSILLEDSEDHIIDSVILRDNIGEIHKICDFTTDIHGFIYILDEGANVWQYDYQGNQKELVIKQGNGLFTGEAKLTCADGIIYIADLTAGNKLTAFSISDGRLLWTMNEIDGLPLFPMDTDADENGNLYILVPIGLTKTPGEEHELLKDGRLGIIKLDGSNRVVRIYKDDSFRLTEGTRLAALRNTAGLEVSRSGDIFVFNSPTKEIFEFHPEGTLRNSFRVEEPEFPSDMAIDYNNTVLISDLQTVNGKASYNSSIFRYDAMGNPAGRITGLSSGISQISLDKRNTVFALDKEGNSITVFKLKKQIKESGIYKQPYGVLITCSLDSTTAETNWHKYVLDADIPEDTQLKISYFASENKELAVDNKKVDADEFIMDNTIPIEYKLELLEKLWSGTGVNPRDSLLHGAKGRYLWLRLEFVGSRENTPLLNKIRVYYPRRSYISYLPLVYQEDPASKDFIERYLSLFETFFSDMDEKIRNISRYFDMDYASGPFLRWLAGWVGIAAGEEWEEEKLKELVKNAVDIYK
ncbi:MAG TPA: hypothetical protein VN580_04375, partial [Clostridia bacterium]|nr:hypothetical protein [Clostridia bacterium]